MIVFALRCVRSAVPPALPTPVRGPFRQGRATRRRSRRTSPGEQAARLGGRCPARGSARGHAPLRAGAPLHVTRPGGSSRAGRTAPRPHQLLDEPDHTGFALPFARRGLVIPFARRGLIIPFVRRGLVIPFGLVTLFALVGLLIRLLVGPLRFPVGPLGQDRSRPAPIRGLAGPIMVEVGSAVARYERLFGWWTL